MASAAKPDAILFDPENWILKKLTFEKAKEELLFQLKNADRIIPRIQACEGLGKILQDDDVIEAVRRAMTKDAFFAVRRAGARGLRESRTEAAQAALMACLQ